MVIISHFWERFAKTIMKWWLGPSEYSIPIYSKIVFFVDLEHRTDWDVSVTVCYKQNAIKCHKKHDTAAPLSMMVINFEYYFLISVLTIQLNFLQWGNNYWKIAHEQADTRHSTIMTMASS